MSLSPLDESGNPVDWWFLYKVPRLKTNTQTEAAVGFEYAYYDDPAEKVVKSPYLLSNDAGALRQTLDQIFGSPSATTGWILYNDETPDDVVSFNLGHTKGVIAFDLATDSAIWLLHSWPKYPSADQTARPSAMFGQTYLCLALSLDTARQLATQMRSHQQPQIYTPRLPTGLAVDDPLRLLAQSVDDDAPGDSNTIDLATRNNWKFKVIAKNRNWNRDFWNDLVAPELQVSIDVETWIRGKNVIPPDIDPSGKYTVDDIKYITLEPLGLPWAWPETKDHAKWAISTTGNWVCVGDINRMISQRQRGGCTIAFQDEALWQLLKQTDQLQVPEGWTKEKTIRAIHAAQVKPE